MNPKLGNNEKNDMLTIDELNESMYEMKKEIDQLVKQYNILAKTKILIEQLMLQQNQKKESQSNVIELPAE